jgi:hypothetical protein
MPITPSLDNATIFLACLGNADDANRWLNASTSDGSVHLTYRLPSIGVDMSGTLWKAALVSGTANTYTLRTLGSVQNASHQYLDASPDGSVSLDSDGSANSAQWLIQVVSNPADYYPHQPWGTAATQSYTFQLKSVHTSTFLDGATGSGTVNLTSDTTLSGTNWLVLVAAWS